MERKSLPEGGTVRGFGDKTASPRRKVLPGYCPARCVMAGLVAPEQGHRLNVHLELCNKARYDFHARITQEDATDTLALAKEFIASLEARLREAEG